LRLKESRTICPLAGHSFMQPTWVIAENGDVTLTELVSTYAEPGLT